MTLSFKNRIAFYYIVTTALLVFVVFFTVFIIVRMSVLSHVDQDIFSEVKKHLSEIKIENNSFSLIHEDEWEEREHKTIDVNPVFVQYFDSNKKMIEKSPNLKSHFLKFESFYAENEIFDATLNQIKIRQIQVPLVNKSKKIGYVVIAMSLEDATIVLDNLLKILAIAYPLILVILFFIARFIAGRSIKPINSIITTTNKITKDNLTDRIELPQNKDELYVVSKTINSLLERIESTIDREKQFTSYASHELRTPIAVIKGTLEVLIRKPRTTAEYKEKIDYCINEVNKINHLIDQLLLLARFENQNKHLQINSTNLATMITEILHRFNSKIELKNILICNEVAQNLVVNTDAHLCEIIVANLISNALKYSNEFGTVSIKSGFINDCIYLSINDKGIGIEQVELDKIFDSFYRTSTSKEIKNIKGTGLGLAIVKKLCTILQIDIKIESQINSGTNITLVFKNL